MTSSLRKLALVSLAGLIALTAGLAQATARDADPDAAPQASTTVTPATSVAPTNTADAIPRPTGEISTTSSARSVPPTAPTPIRIGVDDAAQSIVEAAPEGATFVLTSGVHRHFSVQPKSGQTFRGEPGTVLDGDQVTAHAFHAFGSRPGGADRVTIVGASKLDPLVIRNYAGPVQTGAVHPHVDTRPELGMGVDWLVQWADVHDNRSTGVRVADGMVVRESTVHHNGQLGIGGTGSGIVIEDCVVAYNRTRDDVDPAWEGGGIKLVSTTDATVRRCEVHHNRGNGVWSDIDATGTQIIDNDVHDNEGAGIFDEISYGAEIRGNLVKANGTADDGWFWNAGIQIAGSRNVSIVQNRLVDNRQGIMLLQQRRGSGSQGPYLVDEIVVERNTVSNSGVSGAARDDVTLPLYDATIRFRDNTYSIDQGGDPEFFWNDDLLDVDAWRRLGFDG